MSDDKQQEYDESFVGVLELIWGEGYLSPGGPQEVEKIISGFDMTAKTLLDIGCGTGGIDQLLVQRFGAAHVIGIDTEKSLIEKCEQRARNNGLTDQLTFQHVSEGPLPFADDAFDIVFSKDSLIHIEDKHSICEQVFRVLKPGGYFIASDWMKGEGEISEELKRYIELEDLGFGMGNQNDYRNALVNCGFTDISFTDRNQWYREVAKKEHQYLSGDLYDQLVSIAGKKMADHEIQIWEAMVVVLERGELRPTHWHACKPQPNINKP